MEIEDLLEDEQLKFSLKNQSLEALLKLVNF